MSQHTVETQELLENYVNKVECPKGLCGGKCSFYNNMV